MWPPSSDGSAAARAPSLQTPLLEPLHLWPPLRCGVQSGGGGGRGHGVGLLAFGGASWVYILCAF